MILILLWLIVWTTYGNIWIWGKYGEGNGYRVKKEDIFELSFVDKLVLGPVIWYFAMKFRVRDRG